MRGYHHSDSTDSLTDRQREVIALIAKRRTNGEIATHLGISLDGVKWHVREILAKLEVQSREDAARLWREEQSLSSRLARRMALAPAASTVGVATAGTLVIVATAVVFAFVWGGGREASVPADDSPDTSVSPTVAAGLADTPTRAAPPATLTPEEDAFVALAGEVDAELQQGSVDLLDDRAELEHVVCTHEHYPPRGVDPYPCQSVGDEFYMFIVGYGTHGGRERIDMDDPWGAAASLLYFDEDAADGFGPGYPRIIAAGINRTAGEGMSMVVTRIIPGGPGRPIDGGEPGRPPSRQTSTLEWELIDGEWRLMSIIHDADGSAALALVTRPSQTAGIAATWHPVNALRCPTESSYYPRPDIAGQRIGDVTLSLPQLAETEGVELRALRDSRWATDLPMYVRASEGATVEIEGILRETGAAVSFSHPGNVPASESHGAAAITLEAAMFGQDTPDEVATVRGDLVTSDFGCHEVWVTVDGEQHGPFGFMVWPASQ